MMASDAQISTGSRDLIDCFEQAFTIGKRMKNDTSRMHPKFCENGATDGDQNQRRLHTLSKLKRKLDDFRQELSRKRIKCTMDDDNSCSSLSNVSEPFSEGDSVIEDDSFSLIETDLESSLLTLSTKSDDDKKSPEKVKNTQTTKPSRKELRKRISEKFMLSEWLVDIPEDLEQSWLMLCCPKGRRTMVIAGNGRTKVYTRSGYFLFEFSSLIPGGSPPKGKSSASTRIKSSSILDCIYVESEQRFYLLDVISWNGCSFQDCDTEFRFYWMKRIFDEEQLKPKEDNNSEQIIDVEMKEDEDATNKTKKSKKKPIQMIYDFKPLEFFSCTKKNILEKTQGPYCFETEIDGILFYHKLAPYTGGITPLVCWLKLSMIPKMFS